MAPFETHGSRCTGARSEDTVGKRAVGYDIRSRSVKSKQFPVGSSPLFREPRQSRWTLGAERTHKPCCSPCETMPRLLVLLLGCAALLGLLCLTVAEDAGKALSEEAQAETREKRSMPNWSLSASDFFGWVEQLRSQAGYDRIEDLARTFWAHFPSANRLGYDTPDPEE